MNGQNLLNKNIDEVKVDKSISKIVALAAIGIIFSFFFGYFLKLFILNGQFNFLLFSFVSASGFLVFFFLDVFFIKAFWRANLVIFLESLALLAAFYNQLSITIEIAVLLTFLIFLWGNYAGRQELENILKIKFWQISKKVFPKAIVGLALFISVIYISIVDTEKKEFFISQSTFETIISLITKTKIIQGFLPSFDLSLTTDELINNLASSQIEQNPQSKLLTESDKKQLINQTTKELEKKISEFVGSSLNLKIRAYDAFYEVMTKEFNKLPDSIKPVVPIGIATIIFLVIISLALPIRWLITFLTFILYEIFLAVGFSTIMLEGRSREIILLK